MRPTALTAPLTEKVEAQKRMKTLESERNHKRRELFESQDQIDAQRDGLIQKLEGQLQQKVSTRPLFALRWTLV